MNNELIQKLIEVMHDIRRMMILAENTWENEKNISMLQLQSLKVMRKTPGITVGEFAKNMIMSSAATAQLLDRLVTSGLIEKKIDSKDKRVLRLYLSDSGNDQLRIMKKKMCKKMESIFELIPDKDLKTLLRIQEDLRNKLQEKYKE